MATRRGRDPRSGPRSDVPRRAQAGAQTATCSPQAPGGWLGLIIPHLLPPLWSGRWGEQHPQVPGQTEACLLPTTHLRGDGLPGLPQGPQSRALELISLGRWRLTQHPSAGAANLLQGAAAPRAFAWAELGPLAAPEGPQNQRSGEEAECSVTPKAYHSHWNDVHPTCAIKHVPTFIWGSIA